LSNKSRRGGGGGRGERDKKTEESLIKECFYIVGWLRRQANSLSRSTVQAHEWREEEEEEEEERGVL
jgi:hypothetical protein